MYTIRHRLAALRRHDRLHVPVAAGDEEEVLTAQAVRTLPDHLAYPVPELQHDLREGFGCRVVVEARRLEAPPHGSALAVPEAGPHEGVEAAELLGGDRAHGEHGHLDDLVLAVEAAPVAAALHVEQQQRRQPRGTGAGAGGLRQGAASASRDLRVLGTPSAGALSNNGRTQSCMCQTRTEHIYIKQSDRAQF